MGNTGFAEIQLLDVQGRPVKDAGTEFTFTRLPDNRQLGDIRRLKLPPNPRRFELPAFPQAMALAVRVSASLYRATATSFTLGAGQTLKLPLKVARRPQRWQARFTKWDDLPSAFEALKGAYDRETFENADDEAAILAKAGLLNLHARLSELTEPVEDIASWFSFVRRILRVSRDRIIAVVDPVMGTRVRFIRDNAEAFSGEYEPAPASLHYKNFPAEYRATFTPAEMFSVKSAHSLGNVQLTLAPAREADGSPVLLLDADIDENGELIKHLFDVVFKHKFTGGTHPYDIHELLVFASPGRPLGYTLVPA